MVKGGTTVSGASTVLSSTLQQSFSTQERDCSKANLIALPTLMCEITILAHFLEF